MASSRDGFTKTTIRLLRERVCLRCSNPDCRVQTSASVGKDKVKSIGKAAHICAASEGGPRYEPDMDRADRRSIDNAIWLCGNCHDLVDSDVEKYSVECLLEWKKMAEITSEQEIGKKALTNQDVQNGMAMVMGANPFVINNTALPNVVTALKKSFNEVDSRVEIEFSYINQIQVIELKALESIPISMSFQGSGPNDVETKLTHMFESGESIELNVAEFKVSGSKIFDILELNEASKVTFIPRNKCAVRLDIKFFTLIDKRLNCEFEQASGEMTAGSVYATYKLSIFDGIIQINLKHRLNEPDNVDVFLTLDKDLWNDKSLIGLPHFDRVYRFFYLMRICDKIEVAANSEHGEIFTGEITSNTNSNSNLDTHILLNYVKSCRYFLRHLSLNGIFKDHSAPQWLDVLKTCSLYFHATNDSTLVDELRGLPSVCTPSIPQEWISENAKNFKICDTQEIVIFNKSIALADVTLYLDNYELNTFSDKVLDGMEGYLEPTSSSTCKVQLHS